jgi:proline dehydrogenase
LRELCYRQGIAAQPKQGAWRSPNLTRSLLLKLSENAWLRQHATKSSLLRRGASRFLPGESLADAIRVCRELASLQIGAVLTVLGESVKDVTQVDAATRDYLDALDAIESCGLPAEISVRLTQLGLGLNADVCFSNLCALLQRSPRDRTLWIDMEQSAYVERTLLQFQLARLAHRHVGVCVQAYLRRTHEDVERLIVAGADIRLVKGGYREPAELAFPSKRDVDRNYFELAKRLLSSDARQRGVRVALATHNGRLIQRIAEWANFHGVERKDVEFQMLYGIRPAEQRRLAREGYGAKVLVSYGSHWFPWFMRRLAERPANVLFLVRNLFSR